MQAVEREQHAGLLQGLVVLHHRRDGLGVRQGAGRGLSYPFGIINIMNRMRIFLQI